MRANSLLFVVIAWIFALVSSISLAQNRHPSSGRRLARGHWLTCWGGEESVIRRDPPFHKNSPEDEVAAYVPHFSGQYSFDVRDTWEELVTHFGENCAECGETCSGQGNNRHCSCNSCSWQELETFYRDWSRQNVTWNVMWQQDQEYRKKRQAWIAAGRKDVSRTVNDLEKLFEFDPERPLEYFLFPGEAEVVEVNNGTGMFGSIHIEPTVEINKARYNYNISAKSSRGRKFDCDDQDFHVDASVQTGRRLVTRTPNSIEFRKNWIAAPTDFKGTVLEEPGAFELTDISAMRYEGQDIFDNYKYTQVSVSLWQEGRYFWLIEGKVSRNFRINDNLSVVQWHSDNTSDKNPPVATYNINASDLFRTRYLGSQFHLVPGQTYELCTRVLRNNNIYYRTTQFMGLMSLWSENACGMFEYKPVQRDKDLRSGARKVRDVLARLVGFGLL